MANLTFRSYVGDQPWFFVPDTGTPGGTAVLTGPHGSTTATETQITQKGDRVGFLVPAPFAEPGNYEFTVTQDDVVTIYEIEVLPVERAEPGLVLEEGS